MTEVRLDAGLSVLHRDLHRNPGDSLAALLTVNVIVNRVRAKVDIGDGGVAALAQAIRAQGDFAEHTPLALLLIGLVEAFGYRSAVVNGLAAVLLLARLLSAWGLNSSLKQTFGRQSGAGLTIW